MRPLLLVLLVPALACTRAVPNPALPPAANASDSARFERFIEAYLAPNQGSTRDSSESAREQRWLDGLSAEQERREAAAELERLGRLRGIDTTRLNAEQRVEWLLLESFFKRAAYDTILRPAERIPGRYLTLGNIYWRVVGDRPPRVEDWIAVRTDLRRAPKALALGKAQLKEPPPLWISLAVNTATSYREFLRTEYPAQVARTAPDSLKPSLLAAGDSARLALEDYARFLREELRPGAPQSWASGALYYDWLLKESHFLPFTAATMITEGERIHAETKRALDSLAARMRPGTSWRTLADEMATRHPEPGRIIDAYRVQARKALAHLIRDDLVYIPPGQEMILVPTPPQLRETYAWGGYGGVTPRDSILIGRFFATDVVPGMSEQAIREKLRAQNNGWIAVIAMHEGYPGHHLQTVYTRRNPRRLRRSTGNTYYGEGWALYAEHWMARTGLFDSPDAQLAQLQMRLWRTARVIIDPALHTGRMSYEQAVQFFVDEVGLERSAAEAEVNRFTTWPTQAPSYIVGWLELERLKRELQLAQGERFSEKQFIETVLKVGALPLELLRREVFRAYGLPETARGAGR